MLLIKATDISVYYLIEAKVDYFDQKLIHIKVDEST